MHGLVLLREGSFALSIGFSLIYRIDESVQQDQEQRISTHIGDPSNRPSLAFYILCLQLKHKLIILNEFVQMLITTLRPGSVLCCVKWHTSK